MISLGSLFRRQAAPLAGVDIGASAIKLVELNQNSQGKWILERYASEPLETGWVIDGNIEKFDEVTQALQRLLRKSGTRAKHVALSLPHGAVIAKRISLPGSLSDQELEVQVESEASNYIPFSLDDVCLDFCVLGPNVRTPGDVEVLLVATRKEKVQDREALAQAAGMKPVVIEVDAHAARLAAARLLEPVADAVAPLVGLVKVESTGTSLQVFRGDEVLYDGEQGFGGAQLILMIARQYGISVEEAEVKYRTGDLPADFKTAVLDPFVTSLAQDIGRGLQFFFSSTPYSQVQHLMLFGSAASAEGLASAVQAQTGVHTKVLNPFEGMDIAPGLGRERLAKEAASYMEACGLAMRRFLP